jgi:hypothetical protein
MTMQHAPRHMLHYHSPTHLQGPVRVHDISIYRLKTNTSHQTRHRQMTTQHKPRGSCTLPPTDNPTGLPVKQRLQDKHQIGQPPRQLEETKVIDISNVSSDQAIRLKLQRTSNKQHTPEVHAVTILSLSVEKGSKTSAKSQAI